MAHEQERQADAQGSSHVQQPERPRREDSTALRHAPQGERDHRAHHVTGAPGRQHTADAADQVRGQRRHQEHERDEERHLAEQRDPVLNESQVLVRVFRQTAQANPGTGNPLRADWAQLPLLVGFLGVTHGLDLYAIFGAVGFSV